MLKRIIARLLARRHPWRYVGFSELSELYASSMLRSMALSLVGIFVPIYLYKLDYDLPTIFLFMAGMYGIRLVTNVFVGYLVARVGPKHTMLSSYVVQIISLALLLTLPTYDWPLWVISFSWGLSLSLFFIAYHVDFSKIMRADHGGKELGFMTILERIGGAAGPLIGGVIATVFGAEYTIAVAIALFALAMIPLIVTAEPTQTHQKLNFRSFPIKRLRRDAFAMAALGIDNTLIISMWPLYIGVAILTVNTYASIGLVTSLGIIAAILSAHFIGKIIDHRHGTALLNWSSATSAVINLIRPFIQSFSGIVLTNIVREALTTGYAMPFVKGMYARADELPGFRIVYMIFMENVTDFARTLLWLVAFAAAVYIDPTNVMQWSFVVGSIAVLMVRLQRFPGLKALS